MVVRQALAQLYHRRTFLSLRRQNVRRGRPPEPQRGEADVLWMPSDPGSSFQRRFAQRRISPGHPLLGGLRQRRSPGQVGAEQASQQVRWSRGCRRWNRARRRPPAPTSCATNRSRDSRSDLRLREGRRHAPPSALRRTDSSRGFVEARRSNQTVRRSIGQMPRQAAVVRQRRDRAGYVDAEDAFAGTSSRSGPLFVIIRIVLDEPHLARLVNDRFCRP